MSVTSKLPPSGRDFEVFSAVVMYGKTTREAAEQFKLSQTRVCQIVERVRQWQTEIAPEDSQISDQRLLQFAKVVAAGRLDYLYGETTEAWRRSQGEVKRTRDSAYGNHVTTTTTSFGDSKYLVAAMRLAKAQAELGVSALLLCPPEEEEEEELQGRAGDRAADHPAEDCSENRASPPPVARTAAPPVAAKADGETASAQLQPRQAIARRDFLSPVQTGQTPGEVTRVEITPESIGLSVHEILSRQERRELKRARRAG